MKELAKVSLVILIKIKNLKNERFVTIFIFLMVLNISLVFVVIVVILVGLYKF